MSREIKFRAWDGKAMRESFVVHQASGLPMIEVSGALAFQHDWTVMQYTGIKDKNGVEIYEGDIVSPLGEVVCYQAGFWVKSGKGLYEQLLGIPDDGVVIGNIYENPKLLEASNG